jgi:hypothetical protein
MPVYVDDQENKYGRMVMCHMIADTEDELHEMADKIGVPRRWFQNKPGHPHYDICLTKRKKAVSFGAKEITAKEAVAILKQNYSR